MNIWKFICFFLIGTAMLLVSRVQVNAQSRYGIELEIGAQGALGSKVTYQKVNPGFGLFVEGRLNLPDTGFDVGLQVSTSSVVRKDDSYSYDTKLYPTVLFVSDYNFKMSEVVTPFIGVGLGASDCWYDYLETNGFSEKPYILSVDSFHFTACPRVGVEFFKHLRLSIDYTFTGNRLSNFVKLNLGIVFGGGRN